MWFSSRTGEAIGDFLPEEVQMVRERLPKELQELGADHTDVLIQIAYSLEVPELAEGHVVQTIDVYADDEEPRFSWRWENGEGKVTHIDLQFFMEPHSSLLIEVDGAFRYAEIRGKEVFNRLGKAVFPKEFSNLVMQYQSLLPYTQ